MPNKNQIKPTNGNGKQHTESKIITNNKSKTSNSVTILDITTFIALIITTIITYPKEAISQTGHVTLNAVWYYGWITAISTGFGALPFLFFQEPNKFWLGVSNGIVLSPLCCILIC